MLHDLSWHCDNRCSDRVLWKVNPDNEADTIMDLCYYNTEMKTYWYNVHIYVRSTVHLYCVVINEPLKKKIIANIYKPFFVMDGGTINVIIEFKKSVVNCV